MTRATEKFNRANERRHLLEDMVRRMKGNDVPRAIVRMGYVIVATEITQECDDHACGYETNLAVKAYRKEEFAADPSCAPSFVSESTSKLLVKILEYGGN